MNNPFEEKPKPETIADKLNNFWSLRKKLQEEADSRGKRNMIAALDGEAVKLGINLEDIHREVEECNGEIKVARNSLKKDFSNSTEVKERGLRAEKRRDEAFLKLEPLFDAMEKLGYPKQELKS